MDTSSRYRGELQHGQFVPVTGLNFISDKNALFLIPIQLFNIKSGKVQLMSSVRWPVCFLNRRLSAIGLKIAMPIFKTVFGVHLPRGEYTLSIFKRKWDVVNVFRNLLSHTRKRDKKEIAVQCKVLTNWVLRCNTPVLLKMRPIQTWHFICVHFYADGETLVFSLEEPPWKVKNRNLFWWNRVWVVPTKWSYN